MRLTDVDRVSVEALPEGAALAAVIEASCGLKHVAGCDPTQTITVAAVVRVPQDVLALVNDLNQAKSDLRAMVAAYSGGCGATRSPDMEKHLADLFRGYSRLMCYRQIPVATNPQAVRYFWSSRQRVSMTKTVKQWRSYFSAEYERELQAAHGIDADVTATTNDYYEAIERELSALSEGGLYSLSRPKPPVIMANVKDDLSVRDEMAKIDGSRRPVWFRQVSGSCPIFYAGDVSPKVHYPGDFVRVPEALRFSECRKNARAEEIRGARRKPRNDRRYLTSDRDGAVSSPVKSLPLYAVQKEQISNAQ